MEDEFQWKVVYDIDEMETYYQSLLPIIREVARDHGYAIGSHGSMRRDFDLIAVPWVEKHSTKDILACAIHEIVVPGLMRLSFRWEQKPLGRVATSFPICWTEWKNINGAGHIDLSVVEFKS